MNKLSKIAIVSSLSILGGMIAFGGVVLAQDTNPDLNSDIPPERTDRRLPRYNKNNPNSQNRDINRNLSPSERENMASQNIEPRSRDAEQKSQRVDKGLLNKSERTANREQRIKDRCEAVGIKIINHQNTFTSKSQARLTKYNQITTRLETVSTRLSEKEVDVSTYNSYITELKAKTTALNSLNQDYTQLFGSKSNTGEFCNNKEQLATEVEARKSKLQAVIAKDKEIRMYIKDTILPYLKSIKPDPNNTKASTSVPPSNTTVPVQ